MKDTRLRRDPPFVYIAALIRSGSTLLSEILTLLPYCYIFHEPHLGRNIMCWNAVDVARWKERGVELGRGQVYIKAIALLCRRLGVFPDFVIRSVRQGAFLDAARHAAQLGVKETRNDGWRQYHRHFPGMKALLTGRDPRDIYLSLSKHTTRQANAAGPPEPEKLAGDLMREFGHQMDMRRSVECFPLRYEDLCTDPGLLMTIKNFVHSPIPDSGPVGAFARQTAAKKPDFDLHGGRITSLRVRRWSRETNRQLLAGAWEVYERMQDYVGYWNY